MHAIGDADQAIRLVEVAPLDRVVGHLHDGLPKLDDLIVEERGRLADQHREVVQVLEEIDLAVDLDVNFALESPGCSMLFRQARAAAIASKRSSTP